MLVFWPVNLFFLTYFQMWRLSLVICGIRASLCVISQHRWSGVLLVVSVWWQSCSRSHHLWLIDERCVLSPRIHSHFTRKSSTLTPAGWWRWHRNTKMLLGRYLWAYLPRNCRGFIFLFIWICASRIVLFRDDAQVLSVLAILKCIFLINSLTNLIHLNELVQLDSSCKFTS